MIVIIIALFLLTIPFCIVGFWTKRPIISMCVAMAVSLVLAILPGVIQTFQAMMIYGSGDPQLLAGGISQAIVSGILSMVILLPLLLLFQWAVRARRKSKAKQAAISDFS